MLNLKYIKIWKEKQTCIQYLRRKQEKIDKSIYEITVQPEWAASIEYHPLKANEQNPFSKLS